MNRELSAAGTGLAGNEDILRGVLSGCGDCVKILDLDGRLQFMSDGGKRVMEVDDFSLLKGCPWPDFWEGEGNAQAKQAIDEAKAGRIGHFRNTANTAKGNSRYWDVQVSPIIGPDGKTSHLLSISRDITEQHRAAELQKETAVRQQFLSEELTHRVKNTISNVMAIASQTFKGDQYKEGREKFQARMMALSETYNVLTEASWAHGNIKSIVESTLAPYRSSNGKFDINGPDFNIAPGRALTLALALNELATNAMKYGALSVPEGRVHLFWNKESDGAVQKITFEWREANGPLVAPPTRSGFGSRLIRSMLANDFCGKVDLRYDPTGVVCRLEAPLR
jgi:two-component sensor histidine kinase